MINVVLIVSIDNRDHRNRICNNTSEGCYGSGYKRFNCELFRNKVLGTLAFQGDISCQDMVMLVLGYAQTFFLDSIYRHWPF